RILGPAGLGRRLLDAMVELGARHLRMDSPERAQQGSFETLEFRLEGRPITLRLDYEQPLTTTLLSAVRQLVDQVNHALRQDRAPCRFLLAREACAGPTSKYRLLFAPT